MTDGREPVLDYAKPQKRRMGPLRPHLNEIGNVYFMIAIPIGLVVLFIDWASVPSTLPRPNSNATTRPSAMY